jgi:hypothetical protein
VPANVLMIGGTGALASAISALGFHCIAVPVNSDLHAAETLFNVQQLGDGDTGTVAGSGIDAILLLDVIERVTDPIGTVEKHLGRLNRDGIVVVRTCARREGGGLADPVADLYAFTPEGLNQLLKRSGFSHVLIENIGQGRALAATASRRRLPADADSDGERSGNQRLLLALLAGFSRIYDKSNQALIASVRDAAVPFGLDSLGSSHDIKQLRGTVVAQARELAALRWELGSLLRQNPLMARATSIKQFARRHFPHAVDRAKQLVRVARKTASVMRRPRNVPVPESVDAVLLKLPVLVLDESGLPAHLLGQVPKGEVTTLRGAAGLSTIFVGTADVAGMLRPAEQGSFAQWMIDQNHIRRFKTIVVGRGDAISLSLLRGRLTRQQQLVLTGQGDASQSIALELGNPVEHVEGLALYGHLPDSWLDPLDAQSLPDQSIVTSAQWPKISVVVVSFNQAAFLEEALCSVLDQGYPNLEVLVVDACSSDGSADILERYRHRLDFLLIEPDKGQADGLNKGFARATGEILTWLNSDDLLEPGALFRVAQTFTAHRTDMVVGGCRQTGVTRGDVIRDHHTKLPLGLPVALPLGLLLEVDRFWFTASFFYQPEVFFSRDIWARSGGYLRTDLYYVIDYDLWVRMAAAGATIVHIPEFLACSRTHEQQKTTSGALPFLPELQRVLREYSKRLLNAEGDGGVVGQR